jgi:hypothetical protein
VAKQTRFEELKLRIEKERAHFDGQIPERVALVWHGYLACAVEWSLISAGEHSHLAGMLPTVEDNPVVEILLGKRNA